MDTEAYNTSNYMTTNVNENDLSGCKTGTTLSNGQSK